MSTIEPADTALPNHNNQKKIALINDFTGFGRCSVAVQLPVISQLGVQCCVLPTSVLSNHTGFPSYSFQDFTPYMREHIREWRKLGLKFRGICTGFLGSAEQIAVVSEFIDEFGGPDCIVMVDPVMGDDGAVYKTYTADMCARMRALCEAADCITPNLTEACILLGLPYRAEASEQDMREYAKSLSALGPRYVVITGIRRGDSIVNAGFADGEYFFDRHPRLPAYCSGTGDIFASVVTGALLSGRGFADAVRLAGGFVSDAIRRTSALGESYENGVIFEPLLGGLSPCERT